MCQLRKRETESQNAYVNRRVPSPIPAGNMTGVCFPRVYLFSLSARPWGGAEFKIEDVDHRWDGASAAAGKDKK